MLIAWFPILAIPVFASYVRAKTEEAEEAVSQSPETNDSLSSLFDQTSSACDNPPSIDSILARHPSLPEDSQWDDSSNEISDEDSPDWTEGHWRERRQADDLGDDVNDLLDHVDLKRAKPSFNSWGGKRTSNFHSWGGKRSEDTTTDLVEEEKRSDPYIYLKFADALSSSSGGFKRRPAFNSWGGKRSPPAFNSWGGKRSPPAFNSWGGKRAPAFNSWGGKRAPAFNSWGGKRGAQFNSWGGKRGAQFNSWGGKRGAQFNSWGGKRGAQFNSWGGKRAAQFNSWSGKRAQFNSWGGKRGPAFNSWGGKRSAAFNSWGGKREAPAFNSWGGKREAPAFNSWGGKRGPAFYSWGGKRSVDLVNDELTNENSEVSKDVSSEFDSDSSTGPISLQKRDARNDDTKVRDGHNLSKRETKDVSKERADNAPSDLERVLPSLQDPELQKLVQDFREREKKCSELNTKLREERIRYLLNYILKLSEREPEETKKSMFHQMLLRASNSGYQGSTFSHARRGAEFHSWGGKRSALGYD